MKKLDKLMPIALKAAESHLAQHGKIPKEYKGYVSSFGAMVRTGLRPAVAFYESKSADSAQNRSLLTNALLEIVKAYRDDQKTYKSLMEYVLESSSPGLTKQDIMDAATALKLAMRTFKFE